MRAAFSTIGVTGLLIGGCVSPSRTELTVVTFNIRYDNPGDGEHAWSARRERVVTLIQSFNADLIGLQEVLPNQRAFLEERLAVRAADGADAAAGAFEFRGVGRDDGEAKGEQSPILYRADRFEELAWGTWWLSETPDKPSRGWDAALNRIATWVRLKDRANGETLLAVSTHFDHQGEQARLESARLLAAKLRDETRVVLLGDFNANPGSPPHQAITSSDDDRPDVPQTPLTDAAGDNPSATWCGWDGEPDDGARIDWILVRGFNVSNYRVHEWADRERPESDHLPVVATIRRGLGESQAAAIETTRRANAVASSITR